MIFLDNAIRLYSLINHHLLALKLELKVDLDLTGEEDAVPPKVLNSPLKFITYFYCDALSSLKKISYFKLIFSSSFFISNKCSVRVVFNRF